MMANDFPRQNESENEKLLQKAICIFNLILHCIKEYRLVFISSFSIIGVRGRGLGHPNHVLVGQILLKNRADSILNSRAND